MSDSAAEALDRQRTRNYALRLEAMAEDGRLDLEAVVRVLNEHHAGALPSID